MPTATLSPTLLALAVMAMLVEPSKTTSLLVTTLGRNLAGYTPVHIPMPAANDAWVAVSEPVVSLTMTSWSRIWVSVLLVGS